MPSTSREKRPFFLENEDFFRSPMNLFFTRNIGDPSAGIRLTGKDGPYSLGVMTADDRSPGLALPDYYPLSGMRSYFTIARVSRDIFRQSSVGALYTDWECPTTGEYNRLGGADTHIKLNPNWTLDGQAVTSSSNILGTSTSPTYSSQNCEAKPIPSVRETRATAITTPDPPSASRPAAMACISPMTGSTTTSARDSSPFPALSIASTFANPSRRSTTASVRKLAGSSTGVLLCSPGTTSTTPDCALTPTTRPTSRSRAAVKR